MSDKVISHIGIAVSDLEKAISKYSLITNDDNPEVCEVIDQKVKVAIFKKGEAESRIELVAPTSDDSPVAKFIAKKGEGLHHICIYVDDIKSKLEQLKQAGIRLIDETPRIGAEGNLIAFIHPKDTNGVLIELEQLIN